MADTLCLGFGCLVGSCVVNSLSSHVVGFYVGEILMGIGLAWTTTTMVGYVVGKWFTSKKGTIMGFVLAANGIGGATATDILQLMALVQNTVHDKFGVMLEPEVRIIG